MKKRLMDEVPKASSYNSFKKRTLSSSVFSNANASVKTDYKVS